MKNPIRFESSSILKTNKVFPGYKLFRVKDSFFRYNQEWRFLDPAPLLPVPSVQSLAIIKEAEGSKSKAALRFLTGFNRPYH